MVIKRLKRQDYKEESLINEVRALSSANDFNIVTAHMPCLDDTFLWIITAFVDTTLSDVICANLLPENAIALISRECCSGLDFLHHKGIIHRDIRSAHVLVNLEGHIKLCK